MSNYEIKEDKEAPKRWYKLLRLFSQLTLEMESNELDFDFLNKKISEIIQFITNNPSFHDIVLFQDETEITLKIEIKKKV